jgi:hypothetical protein
MSDERTRDAAALAYLVDLMLLGRALRGPMSCQVLCAASPQTSALRGLSGRIVEARSRTYHEQDGAVQ